MFVFIVYGGNVVIKLKVLLHPNELQKDLCLFENEKHNRFCKYPSNEYWMSEVDI